MTASSRIRLTRVSSPIYAHLLAARLESEGIECRLTGGVDSPYGVGSMAITDIWVHPDDVDDARTVLLVAEVDDTLGGRLSDERPRLRVNPVFWLAAAVLLVVIALGAFLRYL